MDQNGNENRGTELFGDVHVKEHLTRKFSTQGQSKCTIKWAKLLLFRSVYWCQSCLVSVSYDVGGCRCFIAWVLLLVGLCVKTHRPHCLNYTNSSTIETSASILFLTCFVQPTSVAGVCWGLSPAHKMWRQEKSHWTSRQSTIEHIHTPPVTLTLTSRDSLQSSQSKHVSGLLEENLEKTCVWKPGKCM